MLLFSSLVSAETSVLLVPAEVQDAEYQPSLTANLKISNESASVINSVRIRQGRGGATFVRNCNIPPSTTKELPVHLPAISVNESYNVTLVSDGGDAAITRECEISWPVEMVEKKDFIDFSAYSGWVDDYPAWPVALKRNILLACVIAGLCLCCVLLMKRPRVSIIAAVMIICVAGGTVWYLIDGIPSIVEKVRYGRDASPTAAISSSSSSSSLSKTTVGSVIVTCRRTTRWDSGKNFSDVSLYPVYYSPRQFYDDTATIDADGNITVTLRPDDVRLFRRR